MDLQILKKDLTTIVKETPNLQLIELEAQKQESLYSIYSDK
jgi:hypothetical protein